jgi:aerobic-type carbon monoxide dehydrogenase small subunit (CoxS/CutS family)
MVKLIVNGQPREVDAEDDTPLLWALRDHLNLVGTRFGCGAALCGACTVHVDGQPARACMVPLSAVAGRRVTTIEGLEGRVANAVREAWQTIDVPQCGYCQSGQIMSASALLASNPQPSESDIVRAMDGNLCRCGTYERVSRAIKDAARKLEG